MHYTHDEIALLNARRLVNDATDAHTQICKLHYIAEESKGNLTDIDAVDDIIQYLKTARAELMQALAQLDKAKRIVECSTHTLYL